MQFLPNAFSPPFTWSDKQRGLFEESINEVSILYFTSQPNKSRKAIKNRLKDKHNYKTTKVITPAEYRAIMQDLQQAIIAKNPNHFINSYKF